MTKRPLTEELDAIRKRTRGFLGVSTAIHAVLLVLWSLLPDPTPEIEGITEITWVPAPPTAPEIRVAATEEKSAALPAPRESQRHFVREAPDATTAPDPQDLAVAQDRLRALASAQTETLDRRTQLAALTAPSAPAPSISALPGEGPSASARGALVRSSAPSAPPTELTRAVAPATASAPALSKLAERPVAAQPAVVARTSSDVREILSGITLSGQVADRALVSYRAPDFPEWAKTEGVEGSVRVYFEVLPDGRVKKNALVDRTSGFRDFDQNALLALLDWRFEPLEKGAVGEQSGSITVNYRLGH